MRMCPETAAGANSETAICNRVLQAHDSSVTPEAGCEGHDFLSPEATIKCKLAAIFSADGKDYSSLMGEDEAATFRSEDVTAIRGRRSDAPKRVDWAEDLT